ncbi:hypothetical protein Acr_29g0000910 [Actinidia rufa]|uniref:Uncharacterized protein n=1 Tax=Actinidia rufa TaxID=165716 RepID=A0A7J0HCY6_9ERIC|nr:hypothetical protein Acr_29g0000910 [Actinidia rufa]
MLISLPFSELPALWPQGIRPALPIVTGVAYTGFSSRENLNVTLASPLGVTQPYGSLGPFYPNGSAKLKTCTLMLHSLPKPGAGPRNPRSVPWLGDDAQVTHDPTRNHQELVDWQLELNASSELLVSPFKGAHPPAQCKASPPLLPITTRLPQLAPSPPLVVSRHLNAYHLLRSHHLGVVPEQSSLDCKSKTPTCIDRQKCYSLRFADSGLVLFAMHIIALESPM